jgi:site-specific DNA recombinase
MEKPGQFRTEINMLRTLIDAIMVFPGAKRGEVTIELRGDLAALMHVGDDGTPARTAVPRVGNGRSIEVMGSLVAGIGFEPMTFRL